jgi:hypothetical protein
MKDLGIENCTALAKMGSTEHVSSEAGLARAEKLKDTARSI